ncbi:MAG: hypothetical protein M0R03_16865 [Novosphingobium sp.]|nr:hypothetical protein [Novosphingobium sp.]
MLEPAVERANGRYHVDDVYDHIMSGDTVLWAVTSGRDMKAVYTTRLVEYPRCRAMEVAWMGGTGVEEWLDPMLEVLEDHASTNNCAHIEAFGRSGWTRMLKARGWGLDASSFRKELPNEGQ